MTRFKTLLGHTKSIDTATARKLVSITGADTVTDCLRYAEAHRVDNYKGSRFYNERGIMMERLYVVYFSRMARLSAVVLADQ